MDKTKQELREQYEDALFALMMEEYARDEGKQLLERERQLKDDSDFQVPGDFEAKGLQIIRRACRRKNRSIAFRAARKIVARVAVLVLVLDIAFGVSFVSVEAFRTSVLNMVLTYCETHTSIRFTEEEPYPNQNHVYTAEDFLAVLPEDYTLAFCESDGPIETAEIVGPEDVQITWDADTLESTVNVDNEGADVIQELNMGGVEGILTEKNGLSVAVVGDQTTQRMYTITANVDHNMLLDWLNQLFG